MNTVNQASPQAMKLQNKLFEFGLFYQAENVTNIYHVACKGVLQDYLKGTVNWDDDYYDYDFFLQSSNDSMILFHVSCKLLSNSLIVDILNKEIYGMDFDFSDLKRRVLLTLDQKFNLEQNLKRILPLYLS